MVKQSNHPKQSLRNNIFFLFGGLFVFAMTVSLLTIYFFVFSMERDLRRARQTDAAQTASRQIQQFIRQVQNNLLFMVDIQDDEHLDEIAQSTLAANPWLLELVIADTQGVIVTSATRADRMLVNPNNLQSSEWFRETLEVGPDTFYLGELEYGAWGEPFLLMAVPLDTGGVVAMRVDMRILSDVINEIHFGTSSTVYIVAGDGEVIVHPDQQVVDERMTLFGRPELPASTNQRFVNRTAFEETTPEFTELTYTNFRGVPVVGVITLVPGTDIFVFTEISEAENYSISRSAVILRIVGTTVLVLLSVSGVSIFLRRLLFKPLANLQQGQQAVTQGNLDYRVPITRNDEIGQVSEAFNLMVQQLQERSAQKNQQERRMKALYEVMAQSNQNINMQLNQALRVGVEFLELDLGIISQIEGDTYTVLYTYSPNNTLEPGATFDFKQTYCHLTYQASDLVSIDHMAISMYKGHPCYQAFGLEAYIGIPLQIDGKPFGTLNFSSAKVRRVPFEEADRDFFVLMGRWVGAMLERKFAEDALQESRRFAQQIADTAPNIIYIYDVNENRNVYANREVSALLGYTTETLVQFGNMFMPSVMHPDDLPQFMAQTMRLFNSKDGEEFELQYRMRDAQGQWRWFLSRDTVFRRDANGAVIQILGTATEITERRRAEEQITQQNEALVKANRELAVARKQADAANKLKSQFLATMSHELRTPMNAIIGYTQLQLAGMGGDTPEEQAEFQQRILINAQHLLGLINDVLDISKIEAGRMELQDKPFKLRSCIQEVASQTLVLAQNKGLEFVVEVDERLPEMIVGDLSRIKQIILNLLSNAMKFTDQGTVRLETALYDKQNWRITVSDTGIGIAPHVQETIFDEFRQAEDGLQRGGTGLGLAIVRKLVLMMGGNIRVSSDLGQGSVFTVILPLSKETQYFEEMITEETG